MGPFLRILPGLVAILLLGAGSGVVEAATKTATLVVTALVASSGTVAAAPLAMGSADGGGGGLDLGSGGAGIASLTVASTIGAQVAIRLGQGGSPAAGSTDAAPQRRMAGNGAYLEYDLYQDAAGTIPWGNTGLAARLVTGTGAPVQIPVHARIRPGQNVPIGTYSDTVQVSIDY